MKLAGTEESNQSDDDQIKGDNIVQQPGHDQNEDPGDQRYQGSKTQGDIHVGSLSRMRRTTYAENDAGSVRSPT